MPKSRWAYAVLVVSAVGSVALAADPPRHVLEAGSVQVVVEPWNRGVSILLDGVLVSRGSNMVITRPPWAPHYYLGPDAEAVRSATPEQIDGGVRLRMIHRGQNGVFVGEETITVTPDNRVERIIEGRFTKDEGEALIQWQMAGINPALIVGRKYKALLKGGEVHEEVVPVVAGSADVGPSTLAKRFESIEFDSRIGPIRVEVETDQNTICYDYRKNRWSDPSRPLFWLGDMGSRFRKGQPIRYRIVFQLPSVAGEFRGGKAMQTRAVIKPRTDAQTYPLDDPPRIIPRPKKATFAGGYAVANDISQVPFVCVRPKSYLKNQPDMSAAMEALRRYWQERFSSEARRAAPGTGDGPASAGLSMVSFEAVPAGAEIPPEGYELVVAPDEIRVRAADPRGAMYAVQTLKQLTSVGTDGGLRVRCGQIRDWPSLSFRGVHMFTGGQGADLHEKLLRNVIGALKMNRLVLEAEYVEWDSHPEIHHPEYGMSKQDARRVLKVCDELGIEVIPLVMSLGHCQWMFETGHNRELAEDPQAKWAYCVTNPKTYDFIYAIYEEAIELFKPKCFHIGHDEFHHRGRVPYRESSMKYTVEDLFVMDTLRHHEWFARRGVRLMMWGDMLLGQGEGPDACHAASLEAARKLRGQLPKDILIADWHYVDTDPKKFVNLEAFGGDGFQTVAATWYRPGNITNFAQAAHDRKSEGLLQTTWAGYSLDPGRFQKELHQYAAYVLAAEAAWNADRPPDPATYPFASHFLDLIGMSSLKPANRSGWTADLREAYNYPLAAGDADGWFGLGPDYDLASVPGGPVRFKGLAFDLANPADPSTPSAIVLCGRLTRGMSLPVAVEIALGKTADQLALQSRGTGSLGSSRAAATEYSPGRSEAQPWVAGQQTSQPPTGATEAPGAVVLAVLHATNFACRSGTKVGEYWLNYEDGQAACVNLVYGRNVLAYTDLSAAVEAPLVWSGTNAAGQGVGLRALIWDNPHPEKVIRSLTIRSSGAAASLLVLGVTGIEVAPVTE